MSKDIQSTRAARVRQMLGGQLAPVASSGSGRLILYRCPDCQRVWLQDGARRQWEFAEQELARLAQELSAQLDALPLASCRLCFWQRNVGVVEIDEYGSKDGDGKGFGLNWEAPEPVGAHLLATIVAESWLSRQTNLVPDILTTPARLRAVLQWLHDATHFPLLMELTEEESMHIAQGNPPGFGRTGTEGWLWKGGLFQLACPPLRDEALVSLAIALPCHEPLDLAELIELWQLLAEFILLGDIAGEDH